MDELTKEQLDALEFIKNMTAEELTAELDKIRQRQIQQAEARKEAWANLTKAQKLWLVEYHADGFEVNDLRDAILDSFTWAVESGQEDDCEVTFGLYELQEWWNTLDQDDRTKLLNDMKGE